MVTILSATAWARIRNRQNNTIANMAINEALNARDRC
jgi:hypothetical protein